MVSEMKVTMKAGPEKKILSEQQCVHIILITKVRDFPSSGGPFDTVMCG